MQKQYNDKKYRKPRANFRSQSRDCNMAVVSHKGVPKEHKKQKLPAPMVMYKLMANHYSLEMMQKSTEPNDAKLIGIYRYMVRYAATAAVNGNITIFALLRSNIVAVSTVLGYSVNKSIRMRKVRIWAPVTTQGTPVTVAISPVGIDNSNNSYTAFQITVSDTSISPDIPAYIEWRPQTNTPTGSWHDSINLDLALATVTAPIGSIMDIYYEGIRNMYENVLGYTETLVGANAGKFYARAICGNNFVPVYVNTI